MSQAIRKSLTTEERYYQLREPHIGRNGREYKAATGYARYNEEDKRWYTTLVRCSATDNFNRAQGRTLAKRFQLQQKRIDLITNDAPSYDDVVAIYKEA